MGVAFGTENQKWYQDAEESKDVQHQEGSFKLGKQPSGSHVDEDAEEYDGPVKKSDVPVPRNVGVRLTENQKTLDQSTSEKSSGT
jgi:hypothetical protein